VRGVRSLLPARPLLRALLPAACLLFAMPGASAQVLRGSFNALPGADPTLFSPDAMSPISPDTEFRRAPDTRLSENPDTRLEPAPDTEFEPPAVEVGIPPPLAEPVAARRRRKLADEEDPFAPVGIRAGAFIIVPSVEIFGGHDSNPTSADPPEDSLFWRTRGAIDVESDWIRHAFRGRIEAGYRAYDDFPEEDAPDYAADAALRLDAREDLRFDFALRATRDSDTRGDPELVGVTSMSENDRFSGSAGFVYKPNRLSISPTVEFDRRDFGDPDLADRDYSEYEVRLRTGYELSPMLEPFVEASFNQRTYDEDVNDNGVEHDSDGWRTYAGLRLEPNPIWALEAKIGYGEQRAEEDWIPELRGAVAQGTLIWRPSVLTEVRLTAERDFEASTVECCAIAEDWSAGASFSHEFRRWLILTGDLTYEETHYETMDYTVKNWDAELQLEYKFNRMLSALGRVSYERLDSSDSDENYDATIVEVGLKLQR